MAATNDAHYITKEDAKMQSSPRLCIQTGKTIWRMPTAWNSRPTSST